MDTRSSSGLAALVRWYTAKRSACWDSSSPSMSMSLAAQRAFQAASCAASTARQPSAPLRASAAPADGAGSCSGVSARATATRRSNSATCPATERQRQAQRSENGRSGTSGSPPSRSVAPPVIATPLRVPSVRQAPRSCSSRTGSMPRPAIAKLASSLTSMPSRSSASCRNCSPAARSASDRRRSSRPVAVMPAGVRCVHADSSRPRRMSSWRVPSSTSPSRANSGSPSSRMRTRDQSATGTSAGTGGSVLGMSNRPAT